MAMLSPQGRFPLKRFLDDFKAFILRGNVVDLAVGVVIGAAFGTLVASLVKDVLTPLLGVIKTPDFSGSSLDSARPR